MKIIIADDQKLLRDCLKQSIEQYSEIKVVGIAADGKEAIDLCDRYEPDVVLMDIMMPVCDGIEATKIIKHKNKNIKVLILTTSNDNESVDIAIKNGADGYVLKSMGADELILAIKSVYVGLDVFHKDIRRTHSGYSLKADSEKTVSIDTIKVKLSEKDLKIIRLLIDGKSIDEIASQIYLSTGRVRNIITEINSKLMLKDRAQLVAYAVKNNLV